MNTQRESRIIRLSETKTSWEDQGSLEVAAGKLEVMEKFFTPLPHSASGRLAKEERKERSSWNGMQDPYNVESFSSSSPSSSSSQWSSESNFEGQARFSGYHSRAPHSRSCNDLTVGRMRKNDYEKRDLDVKQKASLDLKALERDNKGTSSTRLNRVGSLKKKSHSEHVKHLEPTDNRVREDKKILKDGGRRAKSMETLAQKETGKKQGKEKTKVIEQKKRFSRFLDEITIQVLSPSNLNSLGVKEGKAAGAREPWKNSSTDSSGSRGKISQHTAATEHQEPRRKGKGKVETSTRPKVGVDTPRSRRSREMSTSPDSASSTAWNRVRMDRSPAPSASKSPPRKSKVCDSHRGLQGREVKSKSRFDQMERERNEDCATGKVIIQGWDSYVDKSPNCELSNELTSQASIIPPPDWWRDRGENVTALPSVNNDNVPDRSRRTKESCPGSKSIYGQQENKCHPDTQNEKSETDKDSLNKKITELLDHLVRAQSTICALEKLNVSSLLHHLPPDMLESAKASPLPLDVSSQTEGLKDPNTSTGISAETHFPDTEGGDSTYTTTNNMAKASIVPRPTAFTPWSPKKQKSFPALHTLYTSTESECSLEDFLPTCKFLCPRFPNLGESFSDDRKDGGSLDAAETTAEKRISVSTKSTLPFQNLLPTHRLPHHKHHIRPSSSESSGDDLHFSCAQIPSPDAALDYLSAQNILDTLLGLTSSPEQFPFTHIKNIGAISIPDLPSISHTTRTDFQFSKDFDFPRLNSKQPFHPSVNEGNVHSSEKSSPNSSMNSMLRPKDDPGNRFQQSDYTVPPLPSKRSSLPKGFGSNFLNPAEETRYCPAGKQEGSAHHKSDCHRSPNSVCTQVPGHMSDHLNTHCAPSDIRSPAASGPIASSRESHTSSKTHKLEGGLERKPRKERTVHFQTLNSEGQTRDSQLTLKSKFMTTVVGNQEFGDSASLDSTLL
ncbi:Hypothetical predicted protein [Pelobates cultripes]|uniref:Uncharacterized protein n=1 Tax=Pelobates cultripes TaxID=61616 RepID=A0AAD1TKB4_PELCU|nr:Hypothetical predicted protein [Pelobates cultripes]